MDGFGLLPHPAGNRIKSTAEFYHLCMIMGIVDITDALRLHNAILSLEIKPGLFRRYPLPPQCFDLEQHDNYVAISCSFNDYSADILKYGLTHFFYYNDGNAKTIKDHLSCIRQPYQMMIFTINSGFWWTTLSLVTGLGILGTIHLWGAILVEAFRKEGVSGRMLIWAFDQSSSYYFYRWLIAIPLAIFRWQMRKRYTPKYVEVIFSQYYGIDSGMNDLALFAEGL